MVNLDGFEKENSEFRFLDIIKNRNSLSDKSLFFIYDSYGFTNIEYVKNIGFVHPMSYIFKYVYGYHYNKLNNEKYIKYKELDKILKIYSIDVILEMRGERTLNTENFQEDPFLEILGERGLGTRIIPIIPEGWVNRVYFSNIQTTKVTNGIILKGEPIAPVLELAPALVGSDGRAIVVMQIVSSQPSLLRVIPNIEDANLVKLNRSVFYLVKGENLLYVQIESYPSRPFRLRLLLNRIQGTYCFVDIDVLRMPISSFLPVKTQKGVTTSGF